MIKVAVNWADFQTKMPSIVTGSSNEKILYTLRGGDVKRVVFKEGGVCADITTSVSATTFTTWVNSNISGFLVELDDIIT